MLGNIVKYSEIRIVQSEYTITQMVNFWVTCKELISLFSRQGIFLFYNVIKIIIIVINIININSLFENIIVVYIGIIGAQLMREGHYSNVEYLVYSQISERIEAFFSTFIHFYFLILLMYLILFYIHVSFIFTL